MSCDMGVLKEVVESLDSMSWIFSKKREIAEDTGVNILNIYIPTGALVPSDESAPVVCVHVFEGVKKVADLLGVPLKKRSWRGPVYTTEIYCDYNSLQFFEVVNEDEVDDEFNINQ